MLEAGLSLKSLHITLRGVQPFLGAPQGVISSG